MSPSIITAECGRPPRLGAGVAADGVHFAVLSTAATAIELCLFEPGAPREHRRWALPGRDGDVFFGFVPGLAEGALYGYRAHGPFDPANGQRFDAAKLLVDPYALRLDRPFLHDPALLQHGTDTAPLVPRAIVAAPARDGRALPFAAPGLTYELNVRAFTRRHPGVPEPLRGTILALCEPVILDHLTRIGVETVELMPLAAWIDERHLPPLGLANAWGYNPLAHAAPDPRLAPGGLADIRRAVEALHERGIRVLLDVVLNHSGESDELGATLSYRGLDNALYYRLREDDRALYVNDTGTGNTFALDREPVARMAIDALRSWVETTGIDGFRYDLAPVLGRTETGFRPDAPFFAMVAADPVLAGRIHVAEPWDVGPGGYQLGRFPAGWVEWQDRFRDDVRRFWRGEPGRLEALAARLCGSADLFAAKGRPSFGVNFIAAHDGFSLADLVMYEEKHNEANGENNRDGHGDNHSWNNGAEGPTDDPAIIAARGRDIRALLATLFVARGTPLLVAGDEFGRTQGGNNNAYAQDNATTWLDWAGADDGLIALTARLSRLRREHPALAVDAFLTGRAADGPPDVDWLREDGAPIAHDDWRDPARRFLGLRLHCEGERVLVYLNAARHDRPVRLPAPQEGRRHRLELQSDWPALGARELDPAQDLVVKARSVFILVEEKATEEPAV